MNGDFAARALAFAGTLCDAARPIVMGYFRRPLAIEAKDDLSPVTIADRAAEAAMRAMIREAYPEHGIVGEEMGDLDSGAEYVWAIDPIDGTRSFATGKPLFGTLVALLKDGFPVLGVIDMPALDERWVGAGGRSTTFNGAPVSARRCPELAQAWLYSTSPHLFSETDFAAFERLRKRALSVSYGADCYAYGLIANGTVDLVVEAGMGIYDFCALIPVIEGAGGAVTDWNGAPAGLASDGRIVAAGDKRVLDAALAVLAKK